MKISILILAHKNIEQLIKLVDRLCKDFDVYIHIDEKWKIDVKRFAEYDNVFLIKRYSINWGSYNQILATLQLLKDAYKKDYDFYLFISGQDVPVKSNKDIITFFEQNKDFSFVNYEQLPKKGWKEHNGGYDRIEYYWGNNFKTNVVGIVQKKLLAGIRLFLKILKHKRQLLPVKYYGGWNWVNLNREGMKYLISYLNKNSSYLLNFRYTHCADEIWLQTILANSGCKIINDDLRYVDWSRGGENPKVLVEDDLNKIMQSHCLFARKFDEKIDEKIISKIYQLTA